MEEWRSEERAGNREENEERGEEKVRGTIMAKGGQRERGYVCAVRREGHKILEARLEAARMERKLKKVTRGRSGRARTEGEEKRRRGSGQVGKSGCGEVERESEEAERW